MGCTQSTAVQAPAVGREPGEQQTNESGSRDAGPKSPVKDLLSSPVPSVVVLPASAEEVTHQQSQTGQTDQGGANEDCNVVGTACVPPPGGREGGVLLVGAPPPNVLEIPGEPCGSGRVRRGEVTLAGGTVYEGTWKDAVIDGEGILRSPSGNSYAGSFVSGKVEGQGVFKTNAGLTYEGQWSNGRVNGKGKLTHEDGSIYTGEFRMDIKHGKGVETWADGTVFEGEFKDGEKTGKGKIRFPDGSTYEGQFKEDLFDGKGTYTWANKRRYEGSWKEGVMSGVGVFTWPAGQYTKYEGEFAEGARDGRGVLFVRDGRRYSGEFHRNQLDGEVAEVMPSGKRRRGLWKRGAFERWLEEAEKPSLLVPERDTDQDEEFTTSIFSNPDAYAQVYKIKDRKRLKVKGGVLRSKMKEEDEVAESADGAAEETP